MKNWTQADGSKPSVMAAETPSCTWKNPQTPEVSIFVGSRYIKTVIGWTLAKVITEKLRREVAQ